MKRFLFSLLALAFLSVSAEAASRFAICATTCTWDNTSTAMWSATSGGATGASAPTSADDVTLDANTCTGGTTCTITTFSGTISINSLTMSACTASTSGCILDASANNTNFTISVSGNAFISTGSGTRTLNMGNGTWTLSGAAAIFSIGGATNFTFNANGSTIAFTGTTGTSRRQINMGTSRTINNLTISSSTNPTILTSTSGATITSLTIDPGNTIYLTSGVTLTVTTFNNLTGSSSAQTVFVGDAPSIGRPTLSSANNWTCTWCGFAQIVFTGGGTFTGTSSFDFKNNSGITISPPSGGTSGRIIGG